MILATEIADTILHGFDRHYRLFKKTSQEAKGRWERADWRAAREATQDRIDMYDQRVVEAAFAIEERFPQAAGDEAVWTSVKLAYIGRLYEHPQPECAETFFNSVVRRVLQRDYFGNEHLFSRPAISTEHLDGARPSFRAYYPEGKDLAPTLRAILESFEIERPFVDIDRDVDLLCRAIDEHFPPGWKPEQDLQLQVLRSLFFRNKSAYVVGRVVNGGHVLPFAVPLLHDVARRVEVDAVLLDPKSLGRVFSLGRAYFMVDMDTPSAYVTFLRSVVPSRSRAELYTLLGLQKQGKTLFYRDLVQHLAHSGDRFVRAEGTRGMVMAVFTLKSFPYVFKIIRDWFAPPKDADRAHVEERYRYVKRHDRIGRMADTLEFAHVSFPKDRFEPALLEELGRLAGSCVEVQGDSVVIHHLYVERRLVPLDVYLAHASEERARSAIRDYGNAIKDLAGADIFPGDLLLKNFGVTRFGKVIFYDYDEMTTLLSCRFRAVPKPRHTDDETAGEPWFSIDPGDVFPEQFSTFLFPEGKLRDIFLEEHGDLQDPRTWSKQQERLREGFQEDVFPYERELRFAVRYPRGPA